MRKIKKNGLFKNIIVLVGIMLMLNAILVINGIMSKRAGTDKESVTTDIPLEQRNKPEDYNAPASIEPEALPEDLEATIGFSPHQLSKLTEHYALAKYEIGRDSIVYYYQTAEGTSGERFNVICTKMSENDYFESIPTKNITSESYKGIELTYAERWLYSVPNDFEISEPIQEGIDNGTMEIEYGNTLQEVIKKDCFYWYDNGIKYEIQVRNQNLPYATLYNIAKMIIDAE